MAVEHNDHYLYVRNNNGVLLKCLRQFFCTIRRHNRVFDRLNGFIDVHLYRYTTPLEVIDVLTEHAFHYKVNTILWPTWHFHPEIDVLLNLKHSGSYLVGDAVADLQAGTLIVNAPNEPHALQSAEARLEIVWELVLNHS